MKLHEVITEVIKGRGCVYAHGISPEAAPFSGEYKIIYDAGYLDKHIEKIIFWKITKKGSEGNTHGSIPINIDWNICVSDKDT